MSSTIAYNERSWAIDIISEINIYLNNRSWYFKSAGGESTIKYNKKTLFPDVLLFKDQLKNIILQGWELKMPDTKINDAEFINNAIKKSKILQRESFILWNVKSAVLYVRNRDEFEILKSWDDIAIYSRSEVKANENLWKELLFQILRDLNSFFESGEIEEVTNSKIISIDEVISVVLENTINVAEEIKVKTRSNFRLEAQINSWWRASYSEYGYSKATDIKTYKFPTLSMVVLTDWVFKIIFAHIIKSHFNEAKNIENIQSDTTVSEALDIIVSISQNCDFWNIFSPNLAQEHLSTVAWNQIIELNLFLSNINLQEIDIEILQQLLQSAVVSVKRKVAGQFSTPQKLADLLTRLTVEDKTKTVLDPCCGTGTIIKKAYQLKEEYELTQNEILDTIWASDKHSFPIQLSTLSLAKPENFGKIINIFTKDVIDLQEGREEEFRDPNSGELVKKAFPQIDYIISNLPFIKNKDMKVLNPNIVDINSWIQEEIEENLILSGKSDIFVYIPFYLHKFLSDNGKIGLILSNAWLGTNYGEIFLNLFQKFFSINLIIISGKGKWFKNADVVTTLLIADKKEPSTQSNPNHQISFCTLTQTLSAIDDIKILCEDIILETQTDDLTINSYSTTEIEKLEDIGIPWSAYFADLSWISSISNKLIDANEIFKFTRGERRGKNALFYPAKNHNIEKEYIHPLLKNLKNTKGIKSVANKEAFCCSKSIEELKVLNHIGAINWIKSFEKQTNNKGEFLPIVLARSNMKWYEMQPKKQGDFVANVNFDKTLFIAKVVGDIFIDQRLIVFTKIEEYKNTSDDLLLALLNSTLSMFLIESFGFGRGLGALDLRATKFEKNFKILNPNLLTDIEKSEIVDKFKPIVERDRLPLKRELESEDRVLFETRLMEIFGISDYYEPIKSSLLHLYKIRFAVKV